MPAHGEVVTAEIPAGDQSGTRGFKPRDAVIYLPPAYLTEQRPALPVVVALTGQPGSPSDWYELGALKDTLDAYAEAHDGLAPVVVVADLLGSPYRNPLCSDTVRGGRVATFRPGYATTCRWTPIPRTGRSRGCPTAGPARCRWSAGLRRCTRLSWR